MAFTPISGGATDWGLLYAQTSFVDTKNNRRVQWGWAPEDILDPAVTKKQGFQGAFGLPRELFAHVAKGLRDPGGELKFFSAHVTREDDETYTASTLGMNPLEDVVLGLRQGANHTTMKSGPNEGSLHMELAVTISQVTSRAGLYVAASHTWDEYTLILYDPSNYTILVDRSRSTLASEFVTETAQGFFYPYTSSNGSVEDIKMRVFLDGSLLEVYVNDRFALTTRIYPNGEESVVYGTWDPSGGTTFCHAEAWVGTRNAWPERPLNSSSVLM